MYKKWYNNVLESSFIHNLTILASAFNHVKVEGGNQAAVAYTSVHEHCFRDISGNHHIPCGRMSKGFENEEEFHWTKTAA